MAGKNGATMKAAIKTAGMTGDENAPAFVLRRVRRVDHKSALAANP